MPIIRQELEMIPAPGRRVGVLQAAGISPATYYRHLQPKLPRTKPQRALTCEEQALGERIRALLERYSRWGYRKVWARLRRDEPGLKQGQVYRLMRRRGWLQPRGKRPPAMKRERFPEVTAPNQVWQMDVKAVDLGEWGEYQTINVVDYHSRYWLAGMLADNQRAETLVRTLQLAVEEAQRLGGWEGLVPRLVPRSCSEGGSLGDGGTVLVVTDNGPGFKSRLLREYFRASEGRLRHRRIRRETPEHNGRVERLAGTIAYEIAHRLEGLDPLEAGLALLSFRHEYNHERPHMALDYRYPSEAHLDPIGARAEEVAVPADRHNPPED
jgi:putative transposase